MSMKYYADGELTDLGVYLKTIGGGGEYQKVNCTSAEYAAIDPHDDHTIYIVTYPDGSVIQYLGDEEIGVDRYFTIERAAIVTQEDAETMIIEQEVIDVDVLSGTTAVYGNARNKFIAGGKRVVMASSPEAATASITREDIYSSGVSFKKTGTSGSVSVKGVTINSISFVEDETDQTTKKRYVIRVWLFWQGNGYFNLNVDVPQNNVLRNFGVTALVDTVNQTDKYAHVALCLSAIDSEGNVYCQKVDPELTKPTITALNMAMSDNELNFALGMTERYEVVEE